MLLNLMHYFHAKQWGVGVILGGGQWYKRKDIEEINARIYVFIEEEVTKESKKNFPQQKT
jgi:hypothetical protein